MRHRPFVAIGVAAALLALTAPTVPAAQPDLAAGRYIVILRESTVRPRAAMRTQGVRPSAVSHVYRHALKGYSATLSTRVLRTLQSDPRVARIVPDGRVHVADLPPTVQPDATWGIDRIDQKALPLSRSYGYTSSGAGVTAYVIDTGIRAGHVDLGGRVIGGYDAIDGLLPADDCNGHGTHVAGTIGGTTYGVAKSVTLVAVRVLDCSGSGSFSGVISGIDWVTGDHQAGQPAVANMSLGGGANSALDLAVSNSIADGVVYAIAAGNSSADACRYSPARTPTAITVGATTSSDAFASYSNYGACVDISAPGTSVTSDWRTSDTATNTISGTSMATPHVAGAAARYLSLAPGATPQQVRDALVAGATLGKLTGLSKKTYKTTPNRLLYVDPTR